MQYILSKAFIESNEDMVQILLLFEILFIQDSKVEDLFCGAPSAAEPSLFFRNYLLDVGSKLVKDHFQHDFARMTDKADSCSSGRVVGCSFWECNNQQLSPWVGHSPNLQILLQISVKTVIMVSPKA